MSAHAGHDASEPRVPRTADGIAAALSGSRRMEFYRQLGTAPMDQAEAVLRRWWAEAMLDTDPHAEQVRREVERGIGCVPPEEYREFADLVAQAQRYE